MEGPFHIDYFYFYYKTDGKTIINDTLYTLISDNYGSPSCYLREEGRKVFCRLGPEYSEFVLFDFGLEVGDSLKLHDCSGGGNFTAYVEDIDSILIGSRYHKRFYIQCWEWHSVKFIEGVGSDLGLMYCDIPWVDVYGDLFCFSLNDTIYKTDGTGITYPANCWIYIGISEKEAGQIKVYPNPANNMIYLDYDKKCRSELVNILGIVVSKSETNSLYIKDLSSGIYFLNIYSETGSLLNQVKVMKE